MKCSSEEGYHDHESDLDTKLLLYVHYVRWAPEDMIWMRMIGVVKV